MKLCDVKCEKQVGATFINGDRFINNFEHSLLYYLSHIFFLARRKNLLTVVCTTIIHCRGLCRLLGPFLLLGSWTKEVKSTKIRAKSATFFTDF